MTPDPGAAAPRLTYPLLLELYRGRGTVVEQLTPEERAALAIETPLFTFIREASNRPTPRHIFLTGNAGDGKTFAVVTLPTPGFQVIRDASARDATATAPPIEDLAQRMERALSRGERLLVAINRGQLDRLQGYARRRSGPLARLADQARTQGRLRAVWDQGAADPDVAVIDLGAIDTLSDAILTPIFERLAVAVAGGTLSQQVGLAYSTALEAMQQPRVRDWIRHALRVARARGHHATMRELWSFFAFLVTGGRGPNSSEPVSIHDAVGARLFSEEARGILFEHVRDHSDPAFRSDPRAVRRCMLGTALSSLAAIAGVGPLVAHGSQADRSSNTDGRTLRRVLAVHSSEAATPAQIDDNYTRLLEHLVDQREGWNAMSMIAENLLRGIYHHLRLPRSRRQFPAWQTLCYDSARLASAAAVSTGDLSPGQLRIALPRPNPICQAALSAAWRAPYVWLSVTAPTDAGSDLLGARALRLTPRLFSRLYEPSTEELSDAELFTLRRWVATAHAASSLAGVRDEDRVEVGLREEHVPVQWLVLRRDPLSAVTRMTWEASDV